MSSLDASLFSREAVATALGSLSFRAGPVSGSFFAGHLLLDSFPSLLFVTLSIWIFCLRRSFIHLNFQIWKFKITQEIEKLK